MRRTNVTVIPTLFQNDVVPVTGVNQCHPNCPWPFVTNINSRKGIKHDNNRLRIKSLVNNNTHDDS